MVETQFESKVKMVRSDNRPEFRLVEFYAFKGIIHQTSCVATPQQNGIVEGKHQHILVVTKALLFKAELPNCYWTYDAAHAVHIINRLPTRFLNQKSPYIMLHNTILDLSSMIVFGSLCYVSTLQHNRKKLDPRARKCIYLGVKSGVKGYLVYDLKNREIFLSRDVIFYERHFPYKAQNQNSHTPDLKLAIPCHSPSPDHTVETDPPHPHNLQPDLETEPDMQNLTPKTLQPQPQPEPQPSQPEPQPPQPDTRAVRQRKPPLYLQDYHCSLLSNTDPPSTSSKHPISDCMPYTSLSQSHKLYSLSLSTHTEPQSYQEAMQHASWREAIQA